MDPLKMYFLLESVDSHCYVGLPLGKYDQNDPTSRSILDPF